MRLLTRPVSGGVAHLAVALVGGLAYSHHTALFYTQGSPLTFLALVLFARVPPRIAPRFTQSLTKEALLLLLWQSRARDILINTSAILVLAE